METLANLSILKPFANRNVPDGHMIYMGKDKHENEDLIRYGIPEDVWFHVDNLSSAHVYLRMKRGEKVRRGKDENRSSIIDFASIAMRINILLEPKL